MLYDELEWYWKPLMHMSAIFGLFMLPITLPITMVMILVIYKKDRNLGYLYAKYVGSILKFMFTHDLRQFCDNCEFICDRLD